MKQDIRNIKAGQRFLVIDKENKGFKEGTIVEALESKDNIGENDWFRCKWVGENDWFRCKWVGGNDWYKDIVLDQSVEQLKRFKGKIK